jgi:hypothetical protein
VSIVVTMKGNVYGIKYTMKLAKIMPTTITTVNKIPFLLTLLCLLPLL